MLIRSLVTVATVALAGSMVHANTGPVRGTGGGGARTTTVTISQPTVAAVNAVGLTSANVQRVITSAIGPYVGNSTFRENAPRVQSAVEALAVTVQRKAAGRTLSPEQKVGIEAALKFVAITAAVGDTSYTQRVHRFVANGVVDTILAGKNEQGELSKALEFLAAAGNQNTSMDDQALKNYIDGLVRQMLRTPQGGTVSGLESREFDGSDCFGAANTAG